MKKYLLLFILVITLTGCGTDDTPYKQLTSSVNETFNTKQIKLKVSTSTEEGTPSFNQISFDGINKTAEATFYGRHLFADEKYAYTQLNSRWVKIKLDKPITINGVSKGKPILPAGNKPLSVVGSGSQVIDDTLNGKTLNELVISTGPNTYSISSLEDYLSISTESGLDIELTDPSDDFAASFIYSVGKDIAIPEKAKDAIDMSGMI